MVCQLNDSPANDWALPVFEPSGMSCRMDSRSRAETLSHCVSSIAAAASRSGGSGSSAHKPARMAQNAAVERAVQRSAARTFVGVLVIGHLVL